MSRILVIDDDKATRLQVTRLLELEGHSVTNAENGLLGVEAALENVPEIIVCDIMMPVLDGYGTLLKMREHPQTRLIPFIFLTAKAQLDDLRKGMELGADDYLTKPLNPTSLFNSIQRRLEKKEMQDKESERQKQELTLQIASVLPREVNTSIECLISLSNMLSLKFSEKDEQVHTMCDALQNETLTLKRFIRRIDLFGKLPKLYAHRFDEGIIDNEAVITPPDTLTQSALNASKRFKREDDITLEVTSEYIPLDKDYLEVIVDEFVTNAFQYSKNGTKVTVSVTSESGIISVNVTDQGPGLTNEEIETHLSESDFGQLGNIESGTGMGLPLVNSIARLHGGEISLCPNEGGGLVATVYLPCEPLA